MHWDFTVNVTSLLAIIAWTVAAIVGWCDLTWRVKNLEVWRKETIDGAKARAVIDRDFQQAVNKFETAIATLNVKLAALDREEERRIFGSRTRQHKESE